jgi:hypothetical protein
MSAPQQETAWLKGTLSEDIATATTACGVTFTISVVPPAPSEPTTATSAPATNTSGYLGPAHPEVAWAAVGSASSAARLLCPSLRDVIERIPSSQPASSPALLLCATVICSATATPCDDHPVVQGLTPDADVGRTATRGDNRVYGVDLPAAVECTFGWAESSIVESPLPNEDKDRCPFLNREVPARISAKTAVRSSAISSFSTPNFEQIKRMPRKENRVIARGGIINHDLMADVSDHSMDG